MDFRKKLKAAAKLRGPLQDTIVFGAVTDAVAAGVEFPEFNEAYIAAFSPTPVYAAASLVPEDGWEWAR